MPKPRSTKVPAAIPSRAERPESVRKTLVGFRVNEEERLLVVTLAQRLGYRSSSDILRAAFNEFAARHSKKQNGDH